MSQLLIVVLLIVPIVAVMFLLNYLNKKQKRKEKAVYLDYLRKVEEETGVVPGYQKQLVRQLLVLDEGSKQLLVIHRKEEGCGHTLLRLQDIQSMQVQHNTRSIQNEKGAKETFTEQVGVRIVSHQQPETFLVFYDHEAHSIYLMSELDREAVRVQNRIAEVSGAHIKTS